MHVVRFMLTVAGTMLATAGVSIAGEPSPVIRYQLENGLSVLLAPDERVPKVGMALIYRVGGMNEPAGRSGFAHLFEHLMFTGTAKYPDVDDTYSALGIAHNAYTENDRTIFVADAIAGALPVLLSVEADRMANLGDAVEQRELHLERNVVLNEMRQRVLDAPAQAGVTALRAALYPEPHPYAEAVIGSIADLEAAELSDVKAFFDRYYVPNNAILAIAGDFEPETVKAQIEATFGRIAAGTAVALPEPAIPEPTAVRLTTTDLLPSPLVVLAIAGPGHSDKASTALAVAGDLLGNYEYGALRGQLVNSGLAIGAGARWEPGRLGGMFMVSASAAPGVAPEVLEAAMREAVADFAAGAVAAEDVERTRQSIRVGWQLGIESMFSRADALARDYDIAGEASTGLGDDPVLEQLTAADVSAAFREYVVADAMSVLTILPGPRGDYPDVLKASSGEAEPLAVAPRPAVDVPVLAAGGAERSVLPPVAEAKLSNGIGLVHYQMESAPLALLAATVTGGSSSETPGKEGLIGLTARLMARGAANRDFEAFSKAAKDIGADISGQVSTERTAIVLSVPPERVGAGVELMADAVLRPRLEPAEWQALSAEMRQGLAYAETDPGRLGYLALQRAIFPALGERPALMPTPESVAGLSVEEVRAMHARLFVPAAMTIYSIGPSGIEQVKAELERVLGSWNADGPGLRPRPHPAPSLPAGRRVYVAPSLGNAQATIHLARPAPGFHDAGLVEAVAVSRLLASDSNSRLNAVLRETKGLSYGVDAAVWAAIPSKGLLTLTAPVQADRVGEALADIFAGFASLATAPVSAEELRRTVMATAATQAGAVETSSGLFATVLGAVGVGVSTEAMVGKLDEIVALQLADVQDWGRQLSAHDQAVIVITGDPAAILAQLEAIGITDATVLPVAARAGAGS